MFINNIACNLLDGLRQQQRTSHATFVLLSAFGANLVKEEVDDEPPQPGSLYLALAPPQQDERAYAL